MLEHKDLKLTSGLSWPGLWADVSSEVFGKAWCCCSSLYGRCPFSRSSRYHMAQSSLSFRLHWTCCLPRRCHTWVQQIKETCSAHNHTSAARAKLPSPLHFLCFQHMCFQGWPLILHLCALLHLQNSLEWQLWKLQTMSLCVWRRYLLWFDKVSIYSPVCLFIFVRLCCLSCGKPHCVKKHKQKACAFSPGQTITSEA